MYIGLVGKSCSGKNYVGELLKKRGLWVLDLDELCHKAFELDSITSEIKKAFGPEVFNKDGTVSRKALGKVVFDNPQKREALENILYSWLRKEIARLSRPVTFLNGALLKRAKLDELCSAIVYVDAPFEDRLQRALKRDCITKEDFEKREAAQTDVDFRNNEKNNEYRAPIWVLKNDKNTKELELIRQINIICDRINSISQQENENNEEK